MNDNRNPHADEYELIFTELMEHNIAILEDKTLSPEQAGRIAGLFYDRTKALRESYEIEVSPDWPAAPGDIDLHLDRYYPTIPFDSVIPFPKPVGRGNV